MASSSSKSRSFVRNLVLMLVLVTVVYLPVWYGPVKALGAYLVHTTGYNWTWPALLYLGALAGGFILRVPREAEDNRKLLSAGILFVLVFYLVASLPWQSKPHNSPLSFVGASFFEAFLYQFFFLRICFQGLRFAEEKFYHEPLLKRWGPLSLLIVCTAAGTVAGMSPLFRGSTFDWAQFSFVLKKEMLFGLLYVITRSFWVPGYAHFMDKISAVLW